MPNSRVARPRIRMNSHPSNGSPLRVTFTSSKQVRSKFFQKIGTLCPINKSPQVPVSERSVRDLSNIPRYCEPLRRRRSNNMSCDEPTVKQQKRRGVSFHENVTVVPILLRGDYSTKMKSKLWTNKLENLESVERNMLEFAAEQYDWRNSILEEQMYLCNTTGELVHPVHVELGEYTYATATQGRGPLRTNSV